MNKDEVPQEAKSKGMPTWLLAVIVGIILALAGFFFLTQGVVIEGVLKDAVSGMPIKGATITIGTRSTISDENGRFRLRVPKLEGEVIVNAVGYEPLSAGVEKNLSLTLVPLPETVATYWFNYWKSADYQGMYNLLADECKNAVSREAFQEEFSRYRLEIVDTRAQKMDRGDDTATVLAEVKINTPLGEQTLRFSLQLRKESGIWRIVWYPQGATSFQPPS